MFETIEEKEKIINKWKDIIIKNCPKCNGTGYINESLCDCFEIAKKCVEKECSNIPLVAFQYDDIKIDYNLDEYINYIFNNLYKTKNLYLQDLPYSVSMSVIGYLSDNIIGRQHKITHRFLAIYYCIYENLIQLSLRSNIDKEARLQLNDIITKPNVLIIDNLGLESGLQSQTMHNSKLLQLILKERSNRVKSTILCSKFNINDLEKYYHDDVMQFIISYFEIIKRRG